MRPIYHLNSIGKCLGVAWSLAFLFLMVLCPPGQWKCADGRVCSTCVRASEQDHEDRACDCDEAGIHPAHCRDCCRYVPVEIPSVRQAHGAVGTVPCPAWISHVPPVNPIVVKSLESGCPDASGSPQAPPGTSLFAPRAPPVLLG